MVLTQVAPFAHGWTVRHSFTSEKRISQESCYFYKHKIKCEVHQCQCNILVSIYFLYFIIYVYFITYVYFISASPCSQSFPINPGLHRHWYPFFRSTHVAPFLHGFAITHSLTAANKRNRKSEKLTGRR